MQFLDSATKTRDIIAWQLTSTEEYFILCNSSQLLDVFSQMSVTLNTPAVAKLLLKDK